MRDHIVRNFEQLLSLIFALIVLALIVIGGFFGSGFSDTFGVYATVGGMAFGAAVGYMVAVASTGVVYILLSINEHLAHISSDVTSAT